MGNRSVYKVGVNGIRTYKVPVLFNEEADHLPLKKHDGDAGYDLYVSRDTLIEASSFTDIPTGIKMALPAGLWARITGRSSTLRNRNILVTEGIIDNGFRGELWIGAFNLSNKDVTVKKGERVAQLILHDIIGAYWDLTDELEESDRGGNGFGSTGL